MKRDQARMGTSRIETFSDAVIAVSITIIVLEINVPRGSELSDLSPLIPIFVAYILSFRTIGIYWSNHHRLLQTAKYVDSKIIWANLHLLFWLSLIPFVTVWIGENYTKPWPTAFYGGVLLMASLAYQGLRRAISANARPGAALEVYRGENVKVKLTLGFYGFAILLAFVNYWVSDGLYILVALMWFIPDRFFKILHFGW